MPTGVGGSGAGGPAVTEAAPAAETDDDFWDWFDTPTEVPDRQKVRVREEKPSRSVARRLGIVAAWAGVVVALFITAILVLPRLAGMDVLSVRSGSMAPEISTGDAVLVKHALPADLHPGDVVTYRPPDNPFVLITHRVVSIRYEQGPQGGYGDFVVTTKGDANNAPDPTWRAAPNDVFGKVVLTLPSMGRLLDFLGGGRGKIIAVIAFVAFVVAGSVSRRKARRVAEEAEAAVPDGA
jgi:signal peptidase